MRVLFTRLYRILRARWGYWLHGRRERREVLAGRVSATERAWYNAHTRPAPCLLPPPRCAPMTPLLTVSVQCEFCHAEIDSCRCETGCAMRARGRRIVEEQERIHGRRDRRIAYAEKLQPLRRSAADTRVLFERNERNVAQDRRDTEARRLLKERRRSDPLLARDRFNPGRNTAEIKNADFSA